MIAREYDRTGLRQILKTFNFHTTAQRHLIKADKRDRRPPLRPYLARVGTQCEVEETDRRQRQQAQEQSVSSGVFGRQYLFNVGDAAPNGRPGLFR